MLPQAVHTTMQCWKAVTVLSNCLTASPATVPWSVAPCTATYISVINIIVIIIILIINFIVRAGGSHLPCECCA